MITINLTINDTKHELSLDEAKSLYFELKSIFEKNEIHIPTPFFKKEIIQHDRVQYPNITNKKPNDVYGPPYEVTCSQNYKDRIDTNFQ